MQVKAQTDRMQSTQRQDRFDCQTLLEANSCSVIRRICPQSCHQSQNVRQKRQTFHRNFQRIHELNRANNGSFCLKPNSFASLTDKEFESIYGTFENQKSQSDSDQKVNLKKVGNSFRTNRQHLYWPSGPVDNQGVCGSCWVFAAVHAIAGRISALTNQRIEPDLAEMHMIDCLKSQGESICNDSQFEPGGDPNKALDWTMTHALMHTQQYPVLYPTTAQQFHYLINNPSQCLVDRQKYPNSISKSHILYDPSESEVMFHLESGPIIAYISVTGFWKFYGSGIVHHDSCHGPGGHAILLVGYGEVNGHKYWKLKNSWGTVWGDEGYILMHRADKSNTKMGLGPCDLLKWAWIPGQINRLSINQYKTDYPIQPRYEATRESTTPTTPSVPTTRTRPLEHSGICMDHYEHCKYWAQNDRCRLHYNWMKLECPKSCKFCTEKQSMSCLNANQEYCDQLIMNGWCSQLTYRSLCYHNCKCTE